MRTVDSELINPNSPYIGENSEGKNGVKGHIFDIQRFSLHDGPGIRTTVFFKGCNLRCKWCHNPESQSAKDELMFYKDKCVHCGKCKKFCDKAFTSECVACGNCVSVCSSGALEKIGKWVTVDEVMDTLMRDKPYYKTSGGGVTLSGGEPLLQADFALALLQAIKSAGVHTAVETAGNVPFATLEKIIPFVDLFLFDIKGIDEEKHRANTGVGNRLILQNAEALKTLARSVLFRMPVIPGYNAEEVPAVATFANGSPLELLAYHEIGKGKYMALGRGCDFITTQVPTAVEMSDLARSVGADYHPTGY